MCPDETLALEVRQDRQRRLDRPFGRPGSEHQPQVDHVETLEAEMAQVVVDGVGQLPFGERGVPRAVRAALRADLGDDHEIVGVGVQRFADQLVGDMRAVEVAGVDVIDAGRHGLAQDGERTRVVARRPEDVRPGKLHRAVAEALYDAITELVASRIVDVDHGQLPCIGFH